MPRIHMKQNMNKRESTRLKHLNDFTVFIEYSHDMDDIYKNIKEYSPNKKGKILLSTKENNATVTELFIRGRKLNIPLAFITQCYFAVPKSIRQKHTHYFVMKITNKHELQQSASNHSSDIYFKTLGIFTKNVLQSHICF